MEERKAVLKNSQHQSHLIASIAVLLDRQELLDTTIVCTDQDDHHQKFDCHRIVLAASSTFFQRLYTDVYQGPNSLVVLPREIRGEDFGLLLQYMYHGQVQVPRSAVDRVICAAQTLKIEGLIEVKDNNDFFAAAVANHQWQHPNPWLHRFFYQNGISQQSTSSFWSSNNEEDGCRHVKAYSNQDMDEALEALRHQSMTLTRASEMYKIPATTLWQRAVSACIKLYTLQMMYVHLSRTS